MEDRPSFLRKLEQREEYRKKKRLKAFPPMTIEQLSLSVDRIRPRSLKGEERRFALNGRLVYLEVVGNVLWGTLDDNTGRVLVEFENMMLNTTIEKGQVIQVIGRLKLSPDKRIFVEARGIALIPAEAQVYPDLAGIPLEVPGAHEGERAVSVYWQEGEPVSRAKLSMRYRRYLLIPALLLVLSPYLFRILLLGPMGPSLGFVLFAYVFITGKQVITERTPDDAP